MTVPQKNKNRYLRLHNCFNTSFNACFKYLCLRQFLVPVGCQPNTSQWPFLAQYKMCIKHCLQTKTTKSILITAYLQTVLNLSRKLCIPILFGREYELVNVCISKVRSTSSGHKFTHQNSIHSNTATEGVRDQKLQ